MNNQSEKTPRTGMILLTWGLLGVLAVGIIGLGWYMYPRLQQQGAAIAALRSAQTALVQAKHEAVPAVANVPTVENAKLRDEIAKLERKVAAGIANTRKQAKESSKGAFERAEALINMNIKTVEGRLERLESSHAAEDTHVAELKSEIGQLRQQVARQGTELQWVRRQVHSNATVEDRKIADLKTSEERDRKDVDAVTASLAMRRVDFELTEHHTDEVAPGVYLHINRANPKFSYVDGWMRVMPEDRTFWLRRQNVLEPVIFYGAKESKHSELVVTATRGNSVTGYLLLPGEQHSGKIASLGEGQ